MSARPGTTPAFPPLGPERLDLDRLQPRRRPVRHPWRQLAKAVMGAAEQDLAFPLTEIEPLPMHKFPRLTSRPFTRRSTATAIGKMG